MKITLTGPRSCGKTHNSIKIAKQLSEICEILIITTNPEYFTKQYGIKAVNPNSLILNVLNNKVSCKTLIIDDIDLEEYDNIPLKLALKWIQYDTIINNYITNKGTQRFYLDIKIDPS